MGLSGKNAGSESENNTLLQQYHHNLSRTVDNREQFNYSICVKKHSDEYN